MAKNLKSKNFDKHNSDGLSSLGALLQSDHAGIEELHKFIKNKDKSLWDMVKGVSIARDITEKDMWINIGKAKGLTDDLQVFFKKCIKAYEDRDKK